MSLISEPLETMVRSCGPLRLSAVLDNRSELAGWGAAGARRFRTARGDAFPVVAAISLESAVRRGSAPDNASRLSLHGQQFVMCGLVGSQIVQMQFNDIAVILSSAECNDSAAGRW